jgi:hypothetical protein
MRIASSESRPGTPAPRWERWRRPLWLAVALAAFAGWTALAFSGGMTFIDALRPSLLDLTGTTQTREALGSLLAAPGNYVRAHLAPGPVEELAIDLKFKHLHTLHEKRAEALRTGFLMTTNDDFVPAEIRHDGRTIPVKVRLKGDYTDHLQGDKWSLRVHVKGGDQLFGMRRFSLQAPMTRAFQSEPVILDLMRREGVLAPRYFFVNVEVNGKDIGRMAFEESFSKELLESQRRREGVIIRFDEEPFWTAELEAGQHGPYDNFRLAAIRPFASSEVEKSEKLKRELEIATGLLQGFVDGQLPARDVFDLELMGRFMATAELWQSLHAVRWHNMRFYFNPITARLEPIAFDVNLQNHYQGPGLGTLTVAFGAFLLNDPDLRATFVHNLARMAGEMADGTLVRWARELEAPLLRELHAEFPARAPLQLEALAERARHLRQITVQNFAHFEPLMGDPGAVHSHPVLVYRARDAQGPYLEFRNLLPVAATVTELRAASNPPVPLQLAPPQPLPLVVPATPLLGVPQPLRVRLAEEPRSGPEPVAIEGTLRMDGQPRPHAFRAEPYFPPQARNPIPSATLEQALAQHRFLRWDADARMLRAEPGSWNVAGSLVLPEGAGLAAGPGTTLRFGEKELLIASGPVELAGREDAPVVLEGMPTPSGPGTWGGIVVLGSDRPYAWEHVLVRNTTGVDRNGWALTGGVSLHESQVRIAHSTFQGNRTEDALNIIRSKFELREVEILDTPSDAFDGDFSDGVVLGGRFADIGGDGVDVSGADVSVDGTLFERVHDKAVSVGEGSRVTARNLRIRDVGTALASKDRSEAVIEDSEISGIAYTAIMAYMKKPEYGPARVTARNLRMDGVGRKAAVQTGSRVTLDGMEVPSENLDVDALYSGYMKK